MFSDDNKANLSYEGFYVQNAQKNIENMLEEKVPNIGMNEITKKFIDNMVDNEKGKKRKILKKINENENNNEMPKKQDSGDKNKSRSKISAIIQMNKVLRLDSTSNKGVNKFNVQTTNKNTNNNNTNVIRDNKRTHNTIFSPIHTKDSLLNNKELENLMGNNLYNSSKSNIISSLSTWKINSMKKKPKPISILESTDDNMGISGPILSNNINTSKNKSDYISLKKRKNMGRNSNKLRNTFYTEKLFGRTATTTRTDIDIKNEKNKSVNKFKRNLTNLQLPFLNDNIIFQRGETEKLLNLQFYKTSYKACCEINKQLDMPNSCIRKNYKNNWKLVKQYAKDIKNLKIDSSRKKSTSIDLLKKNYKNQLSSTFEKNK
jgi:hypothetical protein